MARTRAAQGLPPTVEDPATLERVAAVLRLVDLDEPVPPPRQRRRHPPEGGTGALDLLDDAHVGMVRHEPTT